jgi:hypothetical protein
MIRLRALAFGCLLIAGCGDARAQREHEQLARFPKGEITQDGVSPGSSDDLGRPEDLRLIAPVIGRGVCVPLEAARPDGAHDTPRQGVWTYEYVETTRLAGMDGQVRTNFTDIESSSLGLESQGEYQDDHRVGPWIFRHSNGNLRAKGAFVDGLRSGAWEFRKADDSVDPERTGVYVGGKKVSPAR